MVVGKEIKLILFFVYECLWLLTDRMSFHSLCLIIIYHFCTWLLASLTTENILPKDVGFLLVDSLHAQA